MAYSGSRTASSLSNEAIWHSINRLVLCVEQLILQTPLLLTDTKKIDSIMKEFKYVPDDTRPLTWVNESKNIFVVLLEEKIEVYKYDNSGSTRDKTIPWNKSEKHLRYILSYLPNLPPELPEFSTKPTPALPRISKERLKEILESYGFEQDDFRLEYWSNETWKIGFKIHDTTIDVCDYVNYTFQKINRSITWNFTEEELIQILSDLKATHKKQSV